MNTTQQDTLTRMKALIEQEKVEKPQRQLKDLMETMRNKLTNKTVMHDHYFTEEVHDINAINNLAEGFRIEALGAGNRKFKICYFA